MLKFDLAKTQLVLNRKIKRFSAFFAIIRFLCK